MARLVAERGDVIPLLAEVFRAHGFEGASLTRLCEGTRLGKGSIYHFFPGGKDEMAAAVLAEIDRWFGEQVFAPLREAADARAGIEAMFDAVLRYFDAGKRVCLVGMFALGNERDRFAGRVQGYFAEWIAALTAALVRARREPGAAAALAEEIVGGIQGALVLARALDRPEVFADTLARLRARVRETDRPR